MRSQLFRRSFRIKPSSIVQRPACRRSIWRRFIWPMSTSITCSSGSTCAAFSRSLFTNESIERESTSFSALNSRLSSSFASAEKCSALSFISSALFFMFSAWSPMRSKSFMLCSSLETSRLSLSFSAHAAALTRKLPSLSSYVSSSLSPSFMASALLTSYFCIMLSESSTVSLARLAIAQAMLKLSCTAMPGERSSLSSRNIFSRCFSSSPTGIIMRDRATSCLPKGSSTNVVAALNTLWQSAMPAASAELERKGKPPSRPPIP